MGILIGSETVKEFVGSAGMIDLVKVHAVSTGGCLRVQRRLVEEVSVKGGKGRSHGMPLPVQEDQLQYGSLFLLQSQPQMRHFSVYTYCLPCEYVVKSDLPEGGPLIIVFLLPFQGKIPAMPGSDKVGQGHRRFPGKIKFQGLSLSHVKRRDRRAMVS